MKNHHFPESPWIRFVGCAFMILIILAMLLPACSAEVEQKVDPTGTWYGYSWRGQPYTFRIDADGSCMMKKDGFESEYTGNWTRDGSFLTITIGKNLYYFVIKGDCLIFDSEASMFAFDDCVFTHEPFVPFSCQVNQNAAPEDYNGTWKVAFVYKYGEEKLTDYAHYNWARGENLYFYFTMYCTISNDQITWATDEFREVSNKPEQLKWQNNAYLLYGFHISYGDATLSILQNGNLMIDDIRMKTAYVLTRYNHD